MSDKKFLDAQGVETLWNEANKEFINAEELSSVVNVVENAIDSITVNGVKQDDKHNIQLDVQNKLKGTSNQIVGFDENGNAVAKDNVFLTLTAEQYEELERMLQ